MISSGNFGGTSEQLPLHSEEQSHVTVSHFSPKILYAKMLARLSPAGAVSRACTLRTSTRGFLLKGPRSVLVSDDPMWGTRGYKP
jgi:hypothetical protein